MSSLSLFTMPDSNLSEHTACAQVDSKTNQQQWIDKQSNVKILFIYLPEKTLVNTPTELRFSVQNLQTGSHLKNITAVVSVTSQNTLFKFNKVTAPNGVFSLKYIFPNPDTYQVIVKANSKNYSLALASFKVLIPVPPPTSNSVTSQPNNTVGTSTSNLSSSYVILSISSSTIVGVIASAYFLILRKRNTK
jgi:hypothetical protein